MRIAILASNYIRLPPEPGFVPIGFSGAPEKIMSIISEELVKRGHEVTLFASGDSKTSGKLVSVTESSTSLNSSIGEKNHIEFEHLLISKCFVMANEGAFDIIHSGFDTRSAYYAPLVQTPVVSTLHSPISGHKKDILRFFKTNQHYVSISDAQRKPLPDLNYVHTVHHGIDTRNYLFSPEIGQETYMIYVGRLLPEKGIESAIAVAEALQKNLYLLGTGVENSHYWTSVISPKINNRSILQHGFLPEAELHSYYQAARLFLFPIQWEEPFGLVMIESMASGTPVVAFARGSVPEVVKDGVTGFIVNPSDDDIRGNFIVKKTGIEGLKEAVQRIYDLPEADYRQMRQNSRKQVEDNFTVKKMVDGYERVYNQILQKK